MTNPDEQLRQARRQAYRIREIRERLEAMGEAVEPPDEPQPYDPERIIASLDNCIEILKERAALWEEKKRLEAIAKANGIERICKLELWQHPDGYRVVSTTGDRIEGKGGTVEEALLSWVKLYEGDRP